MSKGQVIFLPGVYTISEEEWQHNEDRQEELQIAHAEFAYLYRDAPPEEFRQRKELVHIQARQRMTTVKMCEICARPYISSCKCLE